jgi:hypothetical protein
MTICYFNDLTFHPHKNSRVDTTTVTILWVKECRHRETVQIYLGKGR